MGVAGKRLKGVRRMPPLVSRIGIRLEEAALPKGDHPVILTWVRLLKVLVLTFYARK